MSKFEFNISTRSSWILFCCMLPCLTLGCARSTTGPALTGSQLQGIKAPVDVKELEKKFGPHREATSQEMEALMNTINSMPDAIKANALADQTVAWGSDRGYLVGKMNSSGVVWVLSFHHQD